MARPCYRLSVYVKAVYAFAKKKGFRVEERNNKGSAVHFDLFQGTEKEPCAMWQVHVGHTKQKFVTSKDDLRKPANKMNVTNEEFLKLLEESK